MLSVMAASARKRFSATRSTAGKNMLNSSGASTHPCLRPLYNTLTWSWRFLGSLNIYILVITPPKKLRLPSSTRPQAASRCRHVPSAQQHYDVPAEERPSVPHLGEGAVVVAFFFGSLKISWL